MVMLLLILLSNLVKAANYEEHKSRGAKDDSNSMCPRFWKKKEENGYGSQAVLLGLFFSLQNYIFIVSVHCTKIVWLKGRIEEEEREEEKGTKC